MYNFLYFKTLPVAEYYYPKASESDFYNNSFPPRLGMCRLLSAKLSTNLWKTDKRLPEFR